MANHLVIGLGGTGGSILRELRKRIYEAYGSNEPNDNLLIDYLYLDSDPKDLNDVDNKWNYLGNSVKLAPANLINIHGMGGGVLGNLNAFPGIKSFISPEDNELLRDRQVSDIISTGIGGQRRRFGRMLFANNLANAPQEKQFPYKFTSKLHRLEQQGDGKVTIHICAGLAGGTGSGTIVDVITQIAKITQGSIGADGQSPYPIFLYLYVPELIVSGNADAGYYHANGYAALMELNAISVGKYRPLDVSPNNLDYDGNYWRIPKRVGEIFKKAYLFTDRNSENKTLRKGTKLSAAVADFLYQKMLGCSSGMQRLSEAENQGCQPDNNEDGQPIHSRNFMTFGIKRVVYPESDIRGYISYSNSISMLKMLLCNNWINGTGYQLNSDDNINGLGLDTEVKTPAHRNTYQISDEHLTLQKEIEGYENTKDWSDFVNYWTKISAFMAKKTLEGISDSLKWKGHYLQMMELTFSDNFRNLGVNKFFSIQSQPENVRKFARNICNHIEKVLFNEWLTGLHGEKPQSLQKIKFILQAIQKDCIERMPKVDEMIEKTNRLLTQEIRTKINIATKELEDTGWFANAVFDKRKERFNKFATAKTNEYIALTKLKSYDFEKAILEELSHELLNRIAGLNSLIRLFTLADESLEQASIKITTPPNENLGEVESVERLFDPQVIVNNTEDRIIKDFALQKQIGESIKAKLRDLIDLSGKGRSFGALYTLLGGLANNNFIPEDNQENISTLIGFINENSFIIVAERLDKIAQDDPESQFLRVNILQRIQQECPNDIALRNFIERLVDTARPFAIMNNAAGAVVGTVENATYSNFIQLCLPEYHDTAYRNKFITIFGEVANCEGSDYVAVNSNDNELVIITGTSNVPIRMIQNVTTLKDKYRNLISGAANVNSELNRMLLHSESLGKGLMPDLFQEDPALRSRRIKGYTMRLHSAPDTIIKREDVETGVERNAVAVGQGLKRKTYFVGKDMEETARMMENDHQLRSTLIKYVDDIIMPKYKKNDERKEFRELIENRIVSEILEARCGNNETHPMFKEYCEAAEYVFENELNDR